MTSIKASEFGSKFTAKFDYDCLLSISQHRVKVSVKDRFKVKVIEGNGFRVIVCVGIDLG